MAVQPTAGRPTHRPPGYRLPLYLPTSQMLKYFYYDATAVCYDYITFNIPSLRYAHMHKHSMRRYIESPQNDSILARTSREPGRGNMDTPLQHKQTHQTTMPVAHLFGGSPCPERQRDRETEGPPRTPRSGNTNAPIY